MSGKMEACSENLPIFKQIHINRCFFGELAIGSRQDDRDEAECEKVDAGDLFIHYYYLNKYKTKMQATTRRRHSRSSALSAPSREEAVSSSQVYI